MPVCLFLLTLLALVLGACAATPPPPHNGAGVRLQAASTELQLAAKRELHRGGFYIDNKDPALPLLVLNESDKRGIESLANDGSVGSYEVTYVLTYQMNEQPAHKISLSQVVDYSENRYRASLVQIQQMVADLRRSALAQMLIALQVAS